MNLSSQFKFTQVTLDEVFSFIKMRISQGGYQRFKDYSDEQLLAVAIISKPLIEAHLTTAGRLAIQQLEFYSASSSAAFGTDDNAYPNKLGFVESDEFLCGKFSCGSYLFLAPTNHTAVQIEGSTQLAKKTLDFGQENAITIPLVFQMRAQDKLGYVGGWRSAGNLKNITYTKKMGIDIQVKNEDLFSFDVLVTGNYTKTSLVSPAYSQSKKTTI